MYWRSAVCSSDRPETKFHLADIHISIEGRPALGPGRPAQARGGVEPPGAEPARDKQQVAEPEKPAFHALAPWWPLEATTARATRKCFGSGMGMEVRLESEASRINKKTTIK